MTSIAIASGHHHHIAVLLEEVVAQLPVKRDGLYVDATFGEGGHTRALLAHLEDSGRVIAIDRDATAIARGAENFSKEQKAKRLFLRHGCFSQLENLVKDVIAELPGNLNGEVDGILMDLGISSRQLDDPQRGFSFQEDGPLDMRMDQPEDTKNTRLDIGASNGDTAQPLTAAAWLSRASEKELCRVLLEYGEERNASRIAKAIVLYRKDQPLLRTAQLAELIKKTISPRRLMSKIHPATRSFQGLRIHINNEMEELRQALAAAAKLIKLDGRLAVITFHSLEAHEVKKCRPKFKEVCKVKPSQSEIKANRRSRSAILRVLRRAA